MLSNSKAFWTYNGSHIIKHKIREPWIKIELWFAYIWYQRFSFYNIATKIFSGIFGESSGQLKYANKKLYLYHKSRDLIDRG